MHGPGAMTIGTTIKLQIKCLGENQLIREAVLLPGCERVKQAL